MSNRRRGGGGLAGLITFYAMYKFANSDGFQKTASGLGAAGASFFTLGIIALGGAFLFADPMVFTILAIVGASCLGLGVLFGVINAISNHQAEIKVSNVSHVPPMFESTHKQTNSIFNQPGRRFANEKCFGESLYEEDYREGHYQRTGVGADPRFYSVAPSAPMMDGDYEGVDSAFFVPPVNPASSGSQGLGHGSGKF